MQHVRRPGALIAAGALAAGLLAGLSAGSASASAPVLARQGTLTERPSGYPATGVAALRLQSASVRQDLAGGTVSGTFTLEGAPPASGEHGTLSVNFGNLTNGVCAADEYYGRFQVGLAADLTGSGFSRSGATYTLSKSVAAASWATWDCAYALIIDEADNFADVLIGGLTETHGQPALTISSVSLLGQSKQPLRLARGTWTTLEVGVENPGAADVADVELTGRGKGLKVKKAKVGTVSTVIGSTATIRVKLTGKRKRSTLTLRAAGGGVATERAITVKRIKPRKPVAGRYRDKKKGISFRVRNGRVVQFKGDIQSQCGTWPQYTYNTQQWSFPQTKIGKDGIVDRTVRMKNRRLDLRMRVAGRKATQGRFYYSSPDGYCSGSTFFKARRVGK